MTKIIYDTYYLETRELLSKEMCCACYFFKIFYSEYETSYTIILYCSRNIDIIIIQDLLQPHKYSKILLRYLGEHIMDLLNIHHIT